MKTIKFIKSITVILFLFFCFNANAQKLTQSQVIKENNTVRIYSFEEVDNIQMYFHEGLSKMELTNELEEEYINVIVTYIGKVSRLDDLDKAYTKEEISNAFLVYLDKINTEVKLLLNKNQYIIHQENFGAIERSISERLSSLT